MGQSFTSPFMKVSQESKKNCEKGVSFGALETIERNSDSIDKLSSLVNKMNMKWIGEKPSIDQEYIKVEIEDTVIDKIIIDPGKGSYSRDHIQYNRGRGNHTNRGCRSNFKARSRSRNGYGNRRSDRFDNRQSYRRENFRQEHGEQRYRTRSISQDHDRSRQRFRDSSRSRNQYGQRLEQR